MEVIPTVTSVTWLESSAFSQHERGWISPEPLLAKPWPTTLEVSRQGREAQGSWSSSAMADIYLVRHELPLVPLNAMLATLLAGIKLMTAASKFMDILLEQASIWDRNIITTGMLIGLT